MTGTEIGRGTDSLRSIIEYMCYCSLVTSILGNPDPLKDSADMLVNTFWSQVCLH